MQNKSKFLPRFVEGIMTAICFIDIVLLYFGFYLVLWGMSEKLNSL